jgi:hypothetical protein
MMTTGVQLREWRRLGARSWRADASDGADVFGRRALGWDFGRPVGLGAAPSAGSAELGAASNERHKRKWALANPMGPLHFWSRGPWTSSPVRICSATRCYKKRTYHWQPWPHSVRILKGRLPATFTLPPSDFAFAPHVSATLFPFLFTAPPHPFPGSGLG